MKTFKKLFIFTIIIGVVAMALNTLLGGQTVLFLSKETVPYYGTENHFFIWKFDFWKYLDNIKTTASDISQLEFKLPTRVWNDDIFNDLAYLVDIVILILNVLLYPLRIGAYLIRNILGILGINQNTEDPSNGLAWLVNIIRNILMQIAIPYI